MKKITDLKPNEAIYIRTKKEAKGIGELLNFRPVDIYKKFIQMDNLIFYVKKEIKSGTELPAPDFLPEAKPSLKKRVKILEMQMGELMDKELVSGVGSIAVDIIKAAAEVANNIEVKDAIQELSELPEKWCIAHSSESLKWIRENAEENGCNIHKRDYYFYPCNKQHNNSSFEIPRGYTEITFEQFKKWVMKEPKLLEIGKWYKRKDNKSLFFVTHVNALDNDATAYGFDVNGNWVNESDVFSNSISPLSLPATNEEVSTALIEEAKRRYPIGCTFISVFNNQDGILKHHNFIYDKDKNALESTGFPSGIFKNGKWAEVVHEFDWSKPGHRFIDPCGAIVLSDGRCFEGSVFSGIVIVDSDAPVYGLGYYSENWLKERFKPYTGKPIILGNDE